MLQPQPATAPITTIWSTTEFEFDRVQYAWTIHNFSLCMDGIGKKTVSPVFNAGDGKWSLHLYSNGWMENGGMHVVLMLNSAKKPPLTVKYKYSLWNANQEPVHCSISDSKFLYSVFARGGESGDAHSFIKRDELIPLMKDDELTICCELFVRGKRIDTTHKILPVMATRSLSDDFGSMFKAQKCGDIFIEVGNREFLAYRAILAARSPVFAAMFVREVKEHIPDKVVITDFQPEVVEEMLTYIYTGKSPNIQAMANDLLPIADKYELDHLKLMSAEVLFRKLTIHNAIDTLLLADLYTVHCLQTVVLNFIATNRTYYRSAAVWDKISRMLSKYPNLEDEVTAALWPSKK